MFFRVIAPILIILVFSSCVSQNSLSSTQIPKWYLKTSTTKSDKFYGVGEGKSLQEAKTNALSDMASSLSVTVNSKINQFKQNITSSNENANFKSETTQVVEIETQKISFPNTEVEESQKIKGVYFVLISSNKKKLFDYYKNKFILNNDNILRNINNNSNKSEIEYVFQLQKLMPLIKEASFQALVLNSLDNSFDANSHISHYQEIQKKLFDLRTTLSFEVDTNLPSAFFANIIKRELNQNGYQVVDKNASIVVSLASEVVTKREMAWQTVEVNTIISLLANGKILSSNTIKTRGKSSYSKDDALKIASQSFKEQILKVGLDNFLFNK